MVVERCDFYATVLQGLHRRSDFAFREDEISHDHRIIFADVVESCPSAEGKSWLDFGAGDSNMKVLARHIEADHTSRQVGSWESKDIFDRLPLPCLRLLASRGLCRRGHG